jgi:hypothetical protein
MTLGKRAAPPTGHSMRLVVPCGDGGHWFEVCVWGVLKASLTHRPCAPRVLWGVMGGRAYGYMTSHVFSRYTHNLHTLLTNTCRLMIQQNE